MGRRKRKTRTHDIHGTEKDAVDASAPKSFVVKSGDIGNSLRSLILDVRKVLEPNTATRLRERKSNKLKDYQSMAAPLGVSHILTFSQSSANAGAAEEEEDLTSNVNMRIARLPRGPTLSFKVLRYALGRDILNATKRPHSPGREYATEAMLILNNFSGEDRHVKLMASLFQNLFPSIKVQTMHLTQARRIVLLSYNPQTRTIDFRHYLITIKPIGISRPIRKIIDGTHNRTATTAGSKRRAVPNLSNAEDIADYVLRRGEMDFVSSASEAESDLSEADLSGSENEANAKKVVRLPENYIGRANRKAKGEKRAVRLTELGPRMELGLFKIDEGVTGNEGEVLFHEYVKKSAKEVKEIKKGIEGRKKLLAERKKVQQANVEAKKEAKREKKEAKKQKKLAKEAAGEEASEGEESGSESEEDEFAYEDDFGGESLADGGEAELLEDVLESGEEEEAEQPAKKPKLQSAPAKGKPKFSMKAPRPRS